MATTEPSADPEADHAKSAEVMLINGHTIPLTHADVLEAAKAMADEQSRASRHDTADSRDHERVQVDVEVGGARVGLDLLTLAARALDIDIDRLRPRSARDAIAELDFDVTDVRSDRIRQLFPKATQVEVEKKEGGDLSPELAIGLQRFRGRWVAVSKGRIVADAETLREVHQQVGDLAVSVMFVPLKLEGQA